MATRRNFGCPSPQLDPTRISIEKTTRNNQDHPTRYFRTSIRRAALRRFSNGDANMCSNCDRVENQLITCSVVYSPSNRQHLWLRRCNVVKLEFSTWFAQICETCAESQARHRIKNQFIFEHSLLLHGVAFRFDLHQEVGFLR